MNLKDLKGKIEHNNLIEELVIFKCKDSDFIAHQYIKKYLKNTDEDFTLLDSLDQLRANSSFLSTSIYIYKTDKLSLKTDRFKRCKNLFIICKTIDKDTAELYAEYIIEVPKLEDWQIKDYIHFNCPTVANKLVEWIKPLNSDMYAIENEISKISIFSKTLPEIDTATLDEKTLPGCILNALNDDNAIYYLSGYTIFDFITALLTKDTTKLIKIYNSKIDIPPVLVYQLLYSTIEDIIKITLDATANANKLGISAGKFWAIKNTYSNIWTKEQLTNLLYFLVSIDKLIKLGNLSFDEMLVSIIIEKIMEEY